VYNQTQQQIAKEVGEVTLWGSFGCVLIVNGLFLIQTESYKYGVSGLITGCFLFCFALIRYVKARMDDDEKDW